MSTPTVERSSSVTTPEKPSMAMKAKASVTPPNWASTPDTDTTTRRSREVGGAVTTR